MKNCLEGIKVWFINCYDCNLNKTIPFKGSAIFIHLTKNYKSTAGCIALSKNDMIVLLKIIIKNKN